MIITATETTTTIITHTSTDHKKQQKKKTTAERYLTAVVLFLSLHSSMCLRRHLVHHPTRPMDRVSYIFFLSGGRSTRTKILVRLGFRAGGVPWFVRLGRHHDTNGLFRKKYAFSKWNHVRLDAWKTFD